MTRDFDARRPPVQPDAEQSALRRRFVASLPEQFARLTGAICVAHDGGETAEAYALASRLASTARVHGLELLATRIGTIADRLAALIAPSPALEWSEVRRLLASALDETARAIDEIVVVA